MKILFVKNGVVISSGVAYEGTSISCPVVDSERVESTDMSPDVGWTYADGVFSPPAPIPAKVSPVEFKLLFTPQERVAIKAARQTDPVIDDAYDVLDDPRLTFVDLGLASVQGLIDYMISQGIIASDRREAILSGTLI